MFTCTTNFWPHDFNLISNLQIKTVGYFTNFNYHLACHYSFYEHFWCFLMHFLLQSYIPKIIHPPIYQHVESLQRGGAFEIFVHQRQGVRLKTEGDNRKRRTWQMDQLMGKQERGGEKKKIIIPEKIVILDSFFN